MTEIQQRFLRQIADRLGAERVVELYLFPPIRQGGMESGVAVLAIDEPAAAATDAPAADVTAAPDAAVEAADHAPDLEAADDADDVDDEPVIDVEVAMSVVDDAAAVGPEGTEEADGGVVDAEQPVAVVAPTVPAAGTRRHAVYTARYRYTFKGPERGKWESDVTVEADAPLEAVEAVVRGVQRRAGEFSDAERMTAEAFKAALDAPVWAVEK